MIDSGAEQLVSGSAQMQSGKHADFTPRSAVQPIVCQKVALAEDRYMC